MKPRDLFVAAFVALLGATSVQAHILVSSNRSNSIEEFNDSGTWLRTFATTGPYSPVALAQSPLTGEIFVTTMWASGTYAGQLTNRILRYDAKGQFDVNWDSFTVECSYCPTTVTQSLVFDPSGNLWVATAYGEDLGGAIYIFKYLAADLTEPDPPAQPGPIAAPMFRGNQMAFNAASDLCIAGFIDEDVKCFNTSTGLQTADYYAEIHASAVSPVIQPVGLQFDSGNRMYLTSVFSGQLVREVSPGGPIVLGATLTAPPNELGNLVLHEEMTSPPLIGLPVLCGAACAPALYTTSIAPPPPISAISTPDPVYKISRTVTPIINGTAVPGLGNDHIWGAYWMIFTSSPAPALLVP